MHGHTCRLQTPARALPRLPADTCDAAKSTQLVGVASKGSYTWTATKNGAYYLTCTVGTVGGGEQLGRGGRTATLLPDWLFLLFQGVPALCSPHPTPSRLSFAALHGPEHEGQGHRHRLQVNCDADGEGAPGRGLLYV